MQSFGSYRKKMRAAIYDPYLDTLGGGERYTLSFAKVLADAGYSVDIEWKDKSIRHKFTDRFGIDFSKLNIVRDVKRGDGYDLCFWISDGSIPTLKARRNFLHFQVPFTEVGGKSLLNKMKMFRIEKIICNSYFTKNVIDKEYGVKSVVLYPPVDVDKIKPKRKEKRILFVGRFSKLKQAKNQDLLIKAFKKMVKKGFGDWELVLAGGVEVGVGDYIDKLQRLSKNLPVRIVKSPSFSELKELYGTSKFFWSAAGFGVNEKKEPEKMEHFGITVVEAMAGKCVPIIFEGGGYKEIVDEGKTGFFFTKEGELVKKTADLIGNPAKMREISSSAHEASKVYEYQRFEGEVMELLR